MFFSEIMISKYHKPDDGTTWMSFLRFGKKWRRRRSLPIYRAIQEGTGSCRVSDWTEKSSISLPWNIQWFWRYIVNFSAKLFSCHWLWRSNKSIANTLLYLSPNKNVRQNLCNIVQCAESMEQYVCSWALQVCNSFINVWFSHEFPPLFKYGVQIIG